MDPILRFITAHPEMPPEAMRVLLPHRARLQGPPSLMEFTCRTFPGYQPGTVHYALCDALERFLRAVEARQSPRMIISFPPRHGKSEIASVRFPAWVLGQHPDWPIIHASYSSDLSNDFSRQVRGLLRLPEYQAIFPGVRPSRESRAVDRWGIEGRRGVFVSVGVGGPITGRGARVALIDDPVKNAEEADSAIVRASHREWYRTTLRTRIEDNGGILVILTRWHEADLGGFLLTGAGTDEPPAEAWEEVRFPAVAEDDDPLRRAPGEALWPEKYDEAALAASQAAMSPRWWAAMYQQRPIKAEGNFLPVDKIRHAPHSPRPGTADYALLTPFQAWDLAISQKTTADYAVCGTLGIDADQNVYLLDIRRQRLSFNETMAAMGELGTLWKPVQIGIETTGYQAAAFQEASRRYMLPFSEIKPSKDKVVRAQLLADRIAMGKVFADKSAAWWRDFEHEALAFPQGEHDDQCFVAGTQIATLTGDKPIEAIRVGERVLTPGGVRRVVASQFTGYHPVIERRGLTGTRNHPVYVEGQGFRSMDTLTDDLQCDRLSLGGYLRWTYRRALLSMAPSTGSRGRDAITLAGRIPTRGEGILKDFTSRSGSFIRARQYPKATKFITKTAIRLTTSFLTWSAYRSANIARSIGASVRKNSVATWNVFERRLPNGIAPKPDASGIRRTLNQLSRRVSFWTSRAKSAANPFNPRALAPGTAVLTARHGVGDESDRPALMNASSVAGSLKQSKLCRPVESRRPAVERAEPSYRTRTGEVGRAVYNLTVESDHVYYANGLLVSNCDAMAYALHLAQTHAGLVKKELPAPYFSPDAVTEARRQRHHAASRSSMDS